jgi:mono/diheme cytochrome c family protein
MRRHLALSALVLALAGACASGLPPHHSEAERVGWGGASLKPDPGQVAIGRQVAQRECASCHAIDKTSVSPNLSAPPLREVLAVNDRDFLAYRFIDAMRVGHDEMPLFDFDVRSTDALIAYIESISDAP